MPNTQLQEYVTQQRSSGATDPQILESLKTAGWPQADIAMAMGIPPTPPSVPVPTPVPTPNTSTQPSVPSPIASNPLAGITLPAMDGKTKSIITQCTIYSVIGSAISSGGAFIAQFFIGGQLGYAQRTLYTLGYTRPLYDRFWLMSPGQFIINIIFAVIIGAIVGYIVAAFWPVIERYAKQYTGNFLNTPFKILFYPSLVLALWGFLGAYVFGVVAAVCIVGSNILGRFVFAKAVDGVVRKNFSHTT